MSDEPMRAATLVVLFAAWNLPLPLSEKIEALDQAASLLRESGSEVEQLQLEQLWERS
jgi:hypothetical protein